MIKTFLAKEKNTVFVDVYTPMLSKEGKISPGIVCWRYAAHEPAGIYHLG
jgi:hypothetical protein